MLPRCCSLLSVSLYLFLLALFLALNLKALTNRETFPTVNKHANKSTRGALGFSNLYIQSFTKDTYRRFLPLFFYF